MDEDTWLHTDAPHEIILWLQRWDKMGDRKSRLFAVARCRRLLAMFTDERSQAAIEVAERYTDGLASAVDLAAVVIRLENLVPDGDNPTAQASQVALVAAAPSGLAAARAVSAFVLNALPESARGDECHLQAALLRDIVGNPFRHLSYDATWPVPHAVSLAEQAYEVRHLPTGALDPALLGVLADVLEETGCNTAPMVRHFRQPGAVHVRGCWVVDLLLNRGG